MKDHLHKLISYLEQHVVLQYMLITVVLTVLLEMFNRRSIIEGLLFLFRSPLIFFYNAFPIFLTLFVSLLMRRRKFTVSLIALVWLVCGIANCVILGYRMTPFSAIDLLMIPSAIQMADKFISLGLILLIAAVIIGFFVSIFLLWKKMPKESHYRNRFTVLGILVLMLFCFRLFVNMGIEAKALSDDFENLATAYENYGFAYCFSNSIVDIGIGQPDDYSEEAVDRIMDGLLEDTASSAVTPNIIMIQLESFFDPYYVKDIGFSEDPIPTFRALKEHYSSGYLTVPSVGAGTANTEFEVLTGMSTSYFGAGEYPFKTVMTGTTAEALPYVLRQSGYRSYAIHNNSGTFYNRHTVFANLGFDRFTPLEYMYDTSLTPNNWTKDDVLVDEIVKCLDDSEAQEFVYTISVQSHGRYPDTEVPADQPVHVTASNPAYKLNQYTYYVNQLKEVDNMLAELLAVLEERNEPTILVLYGDHLPVLQLEDRYLTQPSLFETEYVIWDNMGLERRTQNLNADELSSYLLEYLDLKGGILKQFHSTYGDTEQFADYQKMLEYDMLYGRRYAFDGESPYKPTNMEFGIDEIKIESYTVENNRLCIHGGRFNQFSRIVIDGQEQDTEFVNDSTLCLLNGLPEEGSRITVSQMGIDDIHLGRSNTLIYFD